MLPERRLLLAVLLLAVAQQDPAIARPAPGELNTPSDIAIEARLFVDSDEFDLLSRAVEIESSWLRNIEPVTAYRMFHDLMNTKDHNERY